jgi:aldose 1-epimerase
MPIPRRAFLAAPALFAAGACSSDKKSGEVPMPPATQVETQPFGRTPAGAEITKYTLRNAKGMAVSIINYGAIVTSILAPDKAGQTADVALGFSSLEGYLQDHPYFGAIVGRYGNRIAKAKFSLNGKEYKLAANNGPNTLHGGLKGFDKQVWTATPGEGSVELRLTSPDGDEGYPGALTVTVKYSLSAENELRIDYTATSTADTVVNVTNHSYFHLGGEGSGTILDHSVQIESDETTPVDKTLIPTGKLAPVEGTPFDFRTPHAIGERIDAKDEQIAFGGGYDHNWVIRGAAGTLRRAARVKHPGSGRVMEVSTTEPAMQFYTGNFLDGTLTGKSGKAYTKRAGFCMETQHYPDSPNQPSFPSTTLKAGETRRSTTVYKFSAE